MAKLKEKIKYNYHEKGIFYIVLISVSICAIALIWKFSTNKFSTNRIAGPSSTNTPGQLIVYFDADNICLRKSKVFMFSKKDYKALSNSLIILHDQIGSQKSENHKQLINLGRFNFYIIDSHQIGSVTIVSDNNNYARIMPKKNIENFIYEYNKIIDNTNYKININDDYDDDIMRYTEFLANIICVGDYKNIKKLETKSIGNENVIIIHYYLYQLYEETVAIKLKYENFKTIQDFTNSPIITIEKDRILFRLNILDDSTLKDNTLKLCFLVLSIDKTGQVKIENKLLMEIPTTDNAIDVKKHWGQ